MLAISFAICSPADAEIPLESTIIDHTRLLRRALYARTKQNIASSMSPNPDYGVNGGAMPGGISAAARAAASWRLARKPLKRKKSARPLNATLSHTVAQAS